MFALDRIQKGEGWVLPCFVNHNDFTLFQLKTECHGSGELCRAQNKTRGTIISNVSARIQTSGLFTIGHLNSVAPRFSFVFLQADSDKCNFMSYRSPFTTCRNVAKLSF